MPPTTVFHVKKFSQKPFTSATMSGIPRTILFLLVMLRVCVAENKEGHYLFNEDELFWGRSAFLRGVASASMPSPEPPSPPQPTPAPFPTVEPTPDTLPTSSPFDPTNAPIEPTMPNPSPSMDPTIAPPTDAPPTGTASPTPAPTATEECLSVYRTWQVCVRSQDDACQS